MVCIKPRLKNTKHNQSTPKNPQNIVRQRSLIGSTRALTEKQDRCNPSSSSSTKTQPSESKEMIRKWQNAFYRIDLLPENAGHVSFAVVSRDRCKSHCY